MTSDLLPLEQARGVGATLYFTGKPCKHGHICARRVVGAACVECNKEKKRRWSAEHPDRASAWNRRNPEKMKQINNAFYARHRDARKAHVRRWVEANKEYRAAWVAQWVDKNRDAVRASAQKRRALKRGSSGSYTAEDVQVVHRLQSGKCAYCRTPLNKTERHIDHILPLALGGSNDKTNIQLTCATCNRSKSAKHPAVYARELGLLI